MPTLQDFKGVSATTPCLWRLRDGTVTLAIFCRQMATLLENSIPLVEAIELLARNSDDERTGLLLEYLCSQLAAGNQLSEVAACFPRVFPRVFVGMVRAGEASGKLPQSFERLAGLLERDANLVKKVQSTLAYPLFILAATLLLTLLLFYTVMPNFVSIFEEMHISLPWITQLLIWLTRALRNPAFWLMIGGFTSLLTLVFRRLSATPLGAALLYRLLLEIPLLGKAVHYAALARYSLVFGGLLDSGVPLMTAVRVAGEASGSPLLELDSVNVCKSLEGGQPLSAYYGWKVELYSRLMGQFVEVGEESSTLAQILQDIGTWFQEEAQYRLSFVQAAMEPALMTMVSALVGLVVVGIFLPLYSFLGKIGT